MKPRGPRIISVIDDDAALGEGIRKFLVSEGYEVSLFESAEAALEAFKSGHPDLVVSDVVLPGITGIELVKRLLGGQNHLPIILTTAFGSTKVAIEATQAGAYDFLEKPFQLSELIQLIRKALRSFDLVRNRIDLNPEEPTDGVALIGKSEAMNIICKQIGRIASTPAPVLIQGETGTGKELIAQAIFHYSDRRDQPFLAVNCLAIPDNLIESELFGHERGAFTGAHSRRIGRFEQVKKGTLFLDEIGDLPLSTQGKLLRVLQEGSIQRVGSNLDIPIYTRVLAATHRDLKKAIRSGEFREDLYYRLCTLQIFIPPLRERPEDLEALVQFFLVRYSSQFGVATPELTRSSMKRLIQHSWPGNVRELQNVLQKALVECRGLPITSEIVEQCLEVDHQQGSDIEVGGAGVISWIDERLDSEGPKLLQRISQEFEGEVLQRAGERTGWNKKKMSELLGCSRPTIYQKLRHHGWHI